MNGEIESEEFIMLVLLPLGILALAAFAGCKQRSEDSPQPKPSSPSLPPVPPRPADAARPEDSFTNLGLSPDLLGQLKEKVQGNDKVVLRLSEPKAEPPTQELRARTGDPEYTLSVEPYGGEVLEITITTPIDTNSITQDGRIYRKDVFHVGSSRGEIWSFEQAYVYNHLGPNKKFWMMYLKEKKYDRAEPPNLQAVREVATDMLNRRVGQAIRVNKAQ
jgi:hypothetical protein